MTYTQGERYPIPQYSCIQLPDGTALRVGDYAVRRDGKVVKVDGFLPHTGYFTAEGWHYFHSGKHRYNDRDLDLIAKVTSPKVEDAPKMWCDMTPEEKGALLLAKHEGKVIEVYSEAGSKWAEDGRTKFYAWNAYRVKPEPKRESHNLFVYTRENDYLPTPIGTIDYIDGKPDPESVKIGE